MTSGALFLAALDGIGPVIWYAMLQVLPGEGGADGRCRRSVAGADEIAVSGEQTCRRRGQSDAFDPFQTFRR